VVSVSQDFRGGTGESGQDIEHGVVGERLAVGFPYGQRQAQHRCHDQLPPLPVLMLRRIGRQHRLRQHRLRQHRLRQHRLRQHRLRLIPAGQDAVADLAGIGDGERPAGLEQRQLPGHHRRAEPRIVEYLGRELRASPRRRMEPAV
jgi:hypothetical protein